MARGAYDELVTVGLHALLQNEGLDAQTASVDQAEATEVLAAYLGTGSDPRARLPALRLVYRPPTEVIRAVQALITATRANKT